MNKSRKCSRWHVGVFVGLVAAGILPSGSAVAEQAPTAEPPAPQSPAVVPASEPANLNENPYQAISKRNPFGLLPPPPPPDDTPPPVLPPPPPPITIKLTGLTDLLGRKRAMFIFTEQGPNKTPKPLTLTEGERSDGVEILSIDLASNYVKLNNNGQLTNMTFAKMEAPSAAPPPHLPGQPGGPPRVPGAVPPIPNANPNPSAPPPAPNAGNAAFDANGGSVIIGGNADASPRYNSKGGVFSSASANGGDNQGYGNSGGSSISSVGGNGSVPSRDVRTPTTPRPRDPNMKPRYVVPVPPALPAVPGVPTPPQGGGE